MTQNTDSISMNDTISRINDNINNMYHTMNIMSNSMLMSQMNELRRNDIRSRLFSNQPTRFSHATPAPSYMRQTDQINPVYQTDPPLPPRPSEPVPPLRSSAPPSMATFLTSLIRNELPSIGVGSMEISVLGPHTEENETIVISHHNISQNTEIYTKKYDEDILESDYDKCSICLEVITENDVVREIKKCKHSFHVKCVDEWFQNNIKCPNCNQDIRSEINN